jgi:hypothetical protein
MVLHVYRSRIDVNRRTHDACQYDTIHIDEKSIRVLMMEVPADEYFHGFANENEAVEDADNNFEDLILIDELDDEEEDEFRGVGVEITY